MSQKRKDRPSQRKAIAQALKVAKSDLIRVEPGSTELTKSVTSSDIKLYRLDAESMDSTFNPELHAYALYGAVTPSTSVPPVDSAYTVIDKGPHYSIIGFDAPAIIDPETSTTRRFENLSFAVGEAPTFSVLKHTPEGIAAVREWLDDAGRGVVVWTRAGTDDRPNEQRAKVVAFFSLSPENHRLKVRFCGDINPSDKLINVSDVVAIELTDDFKIRLGQRISEASE
jgi:hypothetical protein